MIKFSLIDRRFLFLLLSGHILKSISAACFTPNGTDINLTAVDNNANRNRYQPCNTNANVSMCCSLYEYERRLDQCRGDGLCVNFENSMIWRESCTDPTWQSSSCLKLCIHGTNDQGYPENWGDEIVTVCPDDSLCCGKENTACCATHQGVWIKDGKILSVNPFIDSLSTASPIASSAASSAASSTASSTASSAAASIASSTASSKATSTASPTASFTPLISSSTMSTPSPSSSPAQSGSASSSSNIGPIIGGVAGGGVIGIALGAGIVWLISRRRKLSRLQQSASSVHNVVSSIENETLQPHEIEGRHRNHEIDGGGLVEIDGNAVHRLTAVPMRSHRSSIWNRTGDESS